MQRMFSLALAIGLTALAPGLAPAQNQADRRQRREPGLILETPGRMASCDALTFVHEGKDLYLLAAGDDKVVIVWQVVGNRLVEKRRLRWGIYREQRGSIYALTTFRERDRLKVAVAGWGRQVGQVGVLDFETGNLDHALPGLPENAFAVWSLAASPAGDQVAWGADDGTVWVWDLASGKAGWLGGPLPSWEERKPFRRVHLLTYVGNRRLVSCARDGRVLEWDTARPEAKPRRLFEFDAKALGGVAQAVLSSDQKWVAARGDSRRIEVRSFPDGREEKAIDELPRGEIPESLAFDAHGQRLAVGVRKIDSDAPFFYEVNGEVRVYDLRRGRPSVTARLPTTLFAEALAFDHDGNRLAVAGGDNHEVALWDPSGGKEPYAVPSPGRGLWKVALSADGRSLGVKDHRRGGAAPRSPNDRAEGEYHVFDLGLGAARRDWERGQGFRPVEPVERLGGWSVRFDPRDPFKWYAVGPDGRSHELVLSRALDDLPRCYTFLKATDDKPVRLAVGHYWGASLFEMDPRGPWADGDRFQRSRVYVGHQGYVTSVAPSADHRLLVTAGRDETVNCWSLADWPRQAELGVDFDVRGDKLVAKGVDPGSPAWQAGLGEGSEVVLLETEKGPPVKGGPAAWQKRFESARPFGEFIFRYRNKGENEESLTLMTARQRPVWRFFPTFAAAGGKTVPQDWVLWRWQDYYYDASANGDRFVGWQISGDAADRPVYHAAERLRERFLDPARVRATLARGVSDPQRVQFREIEPPKVGVKAAAPAVKDADVKVTVSADHVGLGELQALARVEVWVNDRYLARTLTAADFKGGDLPATDVTIKADDLQVGTNTIKVIAVNKADGRGEALASVRFDSGTRPVKPVLYGLFAGIGDYSKAPTKKYDLPNLVAARDALAVQELWLGQKGTGLYDNRPRLTTLLDGQATPEAILDHLGQLSKVVRPDDQFVLFLAGHGSAQELPGPAPKNQTDPDRFKPGTFFLVGPLFDDKRLEKTALHAEKLRAALGNLRCHQLVLIDACHSGGLGSSPVRDLRRNGVGAMVLTACKITQSAYEDSSPGKEHGFFMLALQEALGKGFKADLNGDGTVEPSELAEYVIKRVPRLLEEADPTKRGRQTPEVSPWAEELAAYHRQLAKKP
jgi:WD40 repeat protein